MSLLWLLASCPPDASKDTAAECPGITAEEAHTAIVSARCQQHDLCDEATSYASCMEAWRSGDYRVGGLCDYESFDPCGAAACILDLAVDPRSCDEEIPSTNDCHGMFTGFGCTDI